MTKKSRFLVAVIFLSTFLLVASTMAKEAENPVADAQGNLHVPPSYRTEYESLGSWAISADKGAGSKEMHLVYASPGSIAAFKKDGKFSDGTVLVKEVYDASTQPMTTGIVSHPEKLKGWFVMVKDSKNSHPDNKLWAEGWGWSWFDAGKTKKTTSTSFAHDCRSCHVPAEKTDWIYSDGYQTLKR